MVRVGSDDVHCCLAVEHGLWDEQEAEEQKGTRKDCGDVHGPAPAECSGHIATDESADERSRSEEDGVDCLVAVSCMRRP